MDKLTDFLDLPKEIVYDLPKTTLIGQAQLLMENHRGVIEYRAEKIRIAVNLGEMEITGRDLMIRNISRDEILIEGEIAALKYYR
ncbi:MAG TPA: sporulation protein YqfC [Peptococcaceae bacterium]|jgi:sporulation protein YqfC|nr:sporulation protein YqfC [Clostridia bacterium]HOB82302.1 sporulation protein YqfC [Peptococcaceae bacterium]HPZ70690.1 sporulation protein YqfC [Peptococcaceae bacterium]HQD54076.1 sporulation protein YqfC [Peptococcaceae bacterium]